MSKIVAVQSAFPSNYYSQAELTSGLLAYWGGGDFNPKMLERFHRSVKVSGRYLALSKDEYLNCREFEQRNNAWLKVGLELGKQAIEGILERLNLSAGAIDQLIFTTVTGLAVPSLDARLMNQIEFRKDLKRVPLFGLGCVAGAAGIARAHDYLVGHPKDSVILLSVELCSLTVQSQDFSLANMVSSGLFGDGAAAVLIVGDEHPLSDLGLKIIDSQSVFFSNTETVMGWDFTSDGFKIVLSGDVPKVAKEMISPPAKDFLRKNGLEISDITHWICHPGGPKVIDALEVGLGLAANALDSSRRSLSEIGNLSSTSVLMILKEHLETADIKPGSYGVIMAMGPAFCAEMVLVQW